MHSCRRPGSEFLFLLFCGRGHQVWGGSVGMGELFVCVCVVGGREGLVCGGDVWVWGVRRWCGYSVCSCRAMRWSQPSLGVYLWGAKGVLQTSNYSHAWSVNHS